MKNFKFVLLLVLSVMFLTACGGGGGGSSSSDPAPAPTPEPKICYREAVEGETEIRTAAQLAGIASTGKYILMDNISLTGKWTPIALFEGELDGNCYTISGLSITVAEVAVPPVDPSSVASAGLFSSINNAKISRVILADVDINVAYALDFPLNIGSIVGRAINSEITDSHSTGRITATSDRNTLFIGGLLGTSNNTAITDSDSAVAISATTSPAEGGSISYAGGIAAYARYSEFKNTYNTGAITAITNNISNNAHAGGIVGYAVTTVDISNSYNTGAISASAVSSSAYAGGITGYSNDIIITISSSYNTGDVEATSSTNGAYAAGIAGWHSGEISDSYSTGDVEANSDSSSAYAGGIAGSTSNNNNNKLKNAYSTGAIIANGGGTGNAGGIAGYSTDGSIEYCAAINPTITANTNAGHIVGDIFTGTLSNNVARDDISAGDVALNAYGSFTSKTLAELQSQSTYEALGWDFTNIWKMGADYPVLQWQK